GQIRETEPLMLKLTLEERDGSSEMLLSATVVCAGHQREADILVRDALQTDIAEIFAKAQSTLGRIERGIELSCGVEGDAEVEGGSGAAARVAEGLGKRFRLADET